MVEEEMYHERATVACSSTTSETEGTLSPASKDVEKLHEFVS